MKSNDIDSFAEIMNELIELKAVATLAAESSIMDIEDYHLVFWNISEGLQEQCQKMQKIIETLTAKG